MNDRTSEIFDVDTAPTFQIAVLSNFIARPFYEQVGRTTDMNINEWRILLVVAAKPGMVQAEIGNSTGLHKMTVSRSLRSLAKYVALKTHPNDKRKKVAHLTDKGWSIYRDLLPSLRRRQALLAEALEPEESEAFDRILTKLIEAARTWNDADLQLAGDQTHAS